MTSSSMIPQDDPTMLFASAGMVQFKPYWAGTVELPSRRATSIEECLRASDLDRTFLPSSPAAASRRIRSDTL